MEIKCLICGKSFKALGSHLHKIHEISGKEYKRIFDLPQSYALTTKELCDAQADHMRTLRASGVITNEHLPKAVEVARTAGRGIKCTTDIKKQRAIAKQIGPKVRLAPGTKSKTGRDMDNAREYQRQYRRSNHDD